MVGDRGGGGMVGDREGVCGEGKEEVRWWVSVW